MKLNATLIVQAVNFFVCYIVLAKFFFKPALSVLKNQLGHTQKIRNSIAYEHQVLNAQQARKAEAWHECQQFFRQHIPSIALKRVAQMPEYAEIQVKPLSGVEQRKLVHELKEALSAKIKQGHHG